MKKKYTVIFGRALFSFLMAAGSEADCGGIHAFVVLGMGLAVADPGFPRGGGANPRGAPTYYLTKFPQKLHENKDILAPLDPPLARSETDCWNIHTFVFFGKAKCEGSMSLS